MPSMQQQTNNPTKRSIRRRRGCGWRSISICRKENKTRKNIAYVFICDLAILIKRFHYLFQMEPADTQLTTTSAALGGGMAGGLGATGSGTQHGMHCSGLSPIDAGLSPGETQTGSGVTSKEDEEDSSNAASSDCKSPGQRYVNLLLMFAPVFVCFVFRFLFLNSFSGRRQ